MSNHAEAPRIGDEEIREREAVYGGWRLCESLEDVEEQERLVDGYAERNPGMVDRSDAEIARELLKSVRRSIERHGEPYNPGSLHAGGSPPTFTETNFYPTV